MLATQAKKAAKEQTPSVWLGKAGLHGHIARIPKLEMRSPPFPLKGRSFYLVRGFQANWLYVLALPTTTCFSFGSIESAGISVICQLAQM